MTFRSVTPRHRLTLAMVFALAVGTVAGADLKYSCEELGDMAARLHALKAEGYELNDVLVVIQQASTGNAAKEALLSNIAIEIYVDATIKTEQQAKALAHARCNR